MTDTAWSQWLEEHCTLFRLASKEDLAMFGLWRAEFDARSATLAEMKLATTSLMQRAVRIFPGEHPKALLDAIAAGRQLKIRSEAENEVQARDWNCHLCLGAGYVPVPDEGSIVDGELVRPYRSIVSCTCYRGGKFGEWHQRQRDDKKASSVVLHPLMTFQRYEELHPDWRGMVARYREQKKREAELVAQTIKQFHERPMKAILDQIIPKAVAHKVIAAPPVAQERAEAVPSVSPF